MSNDLHKNYGIQLPHAPMPPQNREARRRAKLKAQNNKEGLARVMTLPRPARQPETAIAATSGPSFVRGASVVETVRKTRLILRVFLSPGDIVMMTSAIRDLHKAYPGQYETDIRTSCDDLFENNPYITKIPDNDPDARVIHMEYPLIHQSNQLPYHFIHGYRKDLQEQLGVPIPQGDFKGDIHISELEKSWMSQVEETHGVGARFWLIVAGGKSDFTTKHPDPYKLQEVVNHFKDRIHFVQVGEAGHMHPALENVTDLRGKTNLRQFVRLMYHADGVVCPVTFPMHLAAAVETKPGRAPNRPCVVLGGGREPMQWEAYPHHQFLHMNGALPCCSQGGCWRSRVVPLGDGDHKDTSLCEYPIEIRPGHFLPKCLDMISAQDIISAVEKYLHYETVTHA